MKKTTEQKFVEEYLILSKKYGCDWTALAKCNSKILGFVLRKLFNKSFSITMFVRKL